MKAKDNIDILAKLIIIGDSGVGKTNLILNFVG
jgi:GTPase SAR1 family protein